MVRIEPTGSPLLRALCIAASIVAGCDGGPPEKRVAPVESAEEKAELPVLRDGFEGDALAPFWLAGDHGSGRYAPGAVVVTDERARSGRRSARITVCEGDVAQLGDSGQENERAELDSGKRALLGREAWCGYSFLVPDGFPIVDTRLVLSQWKQSELPGSPLVAQRFRGGRHYVTVRDWDELDGEFRHYELPPIAPGRWNDMVCRVRFSRGTDGLVEIWMNGERVVRFTGTTAGSEGRDFFYHKLGLYRDRMAEPMTVYIDNYSLGGGFDEVDPARFPE